MIKHHETCVNKAILISNWVLQLYYIHVYVLSTLCGRSWHILYKYIYIYMAHFVLAFLDQHRHGRLLLFTALLACVGGGGLIMGGHVRVSLRPHMIRPPVLVLVFDTVSYIKISHCVLCRFAYLMTLLRWGRMRGSHLMAAGTSYLQWPRCDEVAWGSHNTLWQRGRLWWGYASCMTLVGTPPRGRGGLEGLTSTPRAEGTGHWWSCVYAHVHYMMISVDYCQWQTRCHWGSKVVGGRLRVSQPPSTLVPHDYFLPFA